MPFSPLGRGYLTGKLDEHTDLAADDFRRQLPRFTREALGANRALVDLLTVIADRKGSTPAQIALAWLLAKKPWIVPIPGTTKLARLEENIGAVDINLDPAEMNEIDTAAARIIVQGSRYPESLQAAVNR